MVNEDYVSFEVAKLLKEKGFDGVLPFIYVDTEKSDREVHLTDTLCNYNDGHIKDVISAPTLQMAMKWLREVHNIHIVPIHIENRTYRAKVNGLSIFELDNPSVYLYGEYEYVIDFAIKYCLENLI